MVCHGARLLRRWLEQPLLQLDTMAQGAVAELLADPARRQHLRQALKGIADIERSWAASPVGLPMLVNS